MDSILLGGPSGLASVTISSPLNLPQIFSSGSKDKNTNATIRDPPSPAMVVVAHKQVVRVAPSIVLEAVTMRKAEEVLVPSMIQTLLESISTIIAEMR